MLAIPIPSPPMTRHIIKSGMPKGMPDPIALNRNRSEAKSIQRTRPKASAIRPAKNAPIAAPIRARETDQASS